MNFHARRTFVSHVLGDFVRNGDFADSFSAIQEFMFILEEQTREHLPYRMDGRKTAVKEYEHARGHVIRAIESYINKARSAKEVSNG